MTIMEARTVIEMQERNFRQLHNTKFVHGNYEYRIRYEGGFSAFFAIQRREIGKRNFKFFGGFSAADMGTNFAVINEVAEIIREREAV